MMDGLTKLFKSKKFWIAIGAIVVMALRSMGVEAISDDMMEKIIIIALGLIGVQGAVDVALAVKGNKKE